jgi:hypothetical protein
MYNWHYINCIKSEKYSSVEDIKSIDEISEEIKEVVRSLLEEKSGLIQKLTRF